MWETGAAIVTIILFVATSVGILYNRHRKAKKYYDITWKDCSKLPYADVLKERPFTKYYLKRSTDNVISEYLNKNENVLIIGRPLSGKTRAAFESLKQLKKSADVIIPKCTDIDLTDFFIPAHLRYWAKNIILFDDLQRLVEQQNFDHMLRMAMQDKMVIIATCRSEDEYKKAKSKMQEKNLDLESVFSQNIVEIGEISLETAKDVAGKNNVNWNDANFDGTIGSIFLPLGEMGKRFNGCDIKEKEILRAIKSLYTWGVYQGDLLFPMEWIKIVAGVGGLKGEEYEWHEWLEQLKGKEFIELQSGMVKIEEVYLEKIVKPESYKRELALLSDMVGLFSKEPEALFKIGNHLSVVGDISLEKVAYITIAIKAYRESLKTYSPERFPLQYAATQNNLGTAYRTLAEVDDKSENCKLAIEVYKEALKIYTPERFPLDYAMTQNNLGNAYSTLAEVSDKSGNCKSAIAAYKEALKVRTPERFPLQYAMTQNNLGIAYRTLAEVDDTSENCKLAIEFYKEALMIYTPERFPLQYATTQNNLGIAYGTLAEVDDKSENCKLAIEAFEEALKVRTPERFPLDYATTQNNLGNAYRILAEVDDKNENCKLAIEAFEEALKVRTPERFPLDYAKTQYNLGIAYWTLAEVDDKSENCKLAIEAYKEALSIIEKRELPEMKKLVQTNLQELLSFMKEN